MRLKIGYACVFDGDYKNQPDYSQYHNNPKENSFFLYPFTAPEKFLVKAYLDENPNTVIQSALSISDHHTLFLEMVNEGLASDEKSALLKCWASFEKTAEFRKLENTFNEFIANIVTDFTTIN